MCRMKIDYLSILFPVVLVIALSGCSQTVPAVYTDIVINEVQSKDADDVTLQSDFVELYNTSAEAYTFAAGEWFITDGDYNDDKFDIFYIPEGTIIPGYGFLLLLPDVTEEGEVEGTAPEGTLYCTADDINVPFGLGKEDNVSLYYIGDDNTSAALPVDGVAWGDYHVSTKARIPDGEDWAEDYDNAQTPGASNGAAE